MDASRRLCTKLASIGYIIRGNSSNIIMTKSKRLGDCPILRAECLAVQETILIAIQKAIPSYSEWFAVDSQFHQWKERYTKKFVNIVEDVKYLLTRFSDIWLEYCHSIINRDVDFNQKGSFVIFLSTFLWMHLYFLSKNKIEWNTITIKWKENK